MEASLWETIRELEPLRPSFVSVTYGAGGSTRERTHQTVKRIEEETSLTPAAHLTCVGSSRKDIDAIARQYWDAGVKHIVALRGDPPEGSGRYTPHPEGYAYCSDLIAGLKNVADFEISVAAFPEGHPESPNLDADLDNLQRKVDAGANRAITQYFFTMTDYLHFIEKAQKRGITIPIVPGIILISNFKQLVKFSGFCGTNVPSWIYRLLEAMDDNPEQRNIIATLIAVEQCSFLREQGIDQFHFYTLNRPLLAKTVCHTLGITPIFTPS